MLDFLCLEDWRDLRICILDLFYFNIFNVVGKKSDIWFLKWEGDHEMYESNIRFFPKTLKELE